MIHVFLMHSTMLEKYDDGSDEVKRYDFDPCFI